MERNMRTEGRKTTIIKRGKDYFSTSFWAALCRRTHASLLLMFFFWGGGGANRFSLNKREVVSKQSDTQFRSLHLPTTPPNTSNLWGAPPPDAGACLRAGVSGLMWKLNTTPRVNTQTPHPCFSKPNKYACCAQLLLHPWTTPVFAYANDKLEREKARGGGRVRAGKRRGLHWGEASYPWRPHAGV